MKLYYHMTDGGAEYYSTTHAADSDEGTFDGVILRTDGDEIEIFTDRIKAQGLQIVITGDPQEPRAALHEEGRTEIKFYIPDADAAALDDLVKLQGLNMTAAEYAALWLLKDIHPERSDRDNMTAAKAAANPN